MASRGPTLCQASPSVPDSAGVSLYILPTCLLPEFLSGLLGLHTPVPAAATKLPLERRSGHARGHDVVRGNLR
eukprot:14500310-Alexandrium_andersonii.AAC.1